MTAVFERALAHEKLSTASKQELYSQYVQFLVDASASIAPYVFCLVPQGWQRTGGGAKTIWVQSPLTRVSGCVCVFMCWPSVRALEARYHQLFPSLPLRQRKRTADDASSSAANPAAKRAAATAMPLMPTVPAVAPVAAVAAPLLPLATPAVAAPQMQMQQQQQQQQWAQYYQQYGQNPAYAAAMQAYQGYPGAAGFGTR